MLAVGAPRGTAYEPPPWEAELHRMEGNLDAYADELVEALARFPDHPGMLYVVACAEALARREDEAIGHLRRAIQLRPSLAESARANDDLAALRQRADWPVQ